VKLYDFWRSSCAWRVRIALHHKGIAFEQVPVDIVAGENREAAFLALNPLGQVPVLELELGGRVVRLTQSLAMIDCLEQLHPAPSLYPTDAAARAQTLRLAELVASGIQPLQNIGVTRYVSEHGGDGEAFARRYNVRGLAALESAAVESAGRCLVGDEVSLADAFLVPQLFMSRRLGVPLEPYPTLLRVEAALAALPAFIAAHASRQPGAPPA
jgi:maleylpyruvate isomerase